MTERGGSMKLLKLCVLLPVLIACGGFKSTPNVGGTFEFMTSKSVELIPPTDRVDTHCATTAGFDTCIYMKNPVAAADAPVSSDQDRRTRQTFGVRITDTDRSGYLQNENFQVLTGNTSRVSLFDPAMRKLDSPKPKHACRTQC